MKTLKPTKTWILICSILVTTSASESAPSHHDVIQHGDSTPWKKLENTIVPYSIQMPDHVLSAQDLSCISADNNIFEIMNKAQETCNGTDMRCTFYHFVNHGYKNLGTLEIDKERFDDLLMKFDNWLLTAEDIEKRKDDKTKEESSLATASIDVKDGFSNENSSISTVIKGGDAIKERIGKLNLSINESVDDRVHSHHKTQHEIRHKIHHSKDHNSLTAPSIHRRPWKNETHIKLNPAHNTEHRYFEVYIPRDKVTGKPRTIYVEVDQDKNEFVLVDEEVDKKLKGIKPIRIELDELSEIADTVFSEITRTSDFKEHVHNYLNDDEKAIISDISKHSEVNVDAVHLDNIDVGEQTLNSINPSEYHPNFYNREAEEQHKPEDMAGNVKKIKNDNVNLTELNKYINQAQYNMELHIDNSTDEKQNDHFELLESNNSETDTRTDFDEMEEPFDTIVYNEINTYGLNGTENSSLDYPDISYENVNDTTDYYELSTEHENVTSDDDFFVQIEEHNDTYHDDYDDSHNLSSSNTLNLNELSVQVENPENPTQENKLKSTPFNNAELKLTSSVNAVISDYTDSQLHAENRQGVYTDQCDFSLEPSIALKPYTSAPILGKDSAKILNSDSYLKSSSPTYATLDLHAEDSQNTPSNSVVEHPSISSYISPLDSVCAPSAAPKISQYSPPIVLSPPVECIVKSNKDSPYSPLNFGVNWLPSHSKSEELQLPCDMNTLSLDHVFSPQDSLPPLTVPNMEYIGSSHQTAPVKDTTFIQTVPSSSYVIQEPYLITTPYELETTAPLPSKHVLLSKLGLPKSNADDERISTPYPSSVKPCSLNDAVSSPCPIQQNVPCLQKNTVSPIDSPYSANSIRYPYTTMPYFSNPYFKPPQFTPSYLGTLLKTPLQPASKIPTLDSVPTPLDQSNPCLTGVCPQEKTPIQLLPFAPNSQFSPLNPMLVGSGFPCALPCPKLWNNIPYLPYIDQNIRNSPPFLGNYLTATTDQNHKPLLSKPVPLSVVEHPCSSNNILEFTPSSYTPFLPAHTSQIQKDLNPSQALERDLESLSLKYGIPLSKILHSIETEIFDGKTCLPIPEVPNSNLKYDTSLTAQESYTLSETNENVNDENISGDEQLLESELTNLTPLETSLIGPHLEIENSLDTHNSQCYNILSEITGPAPTPHLSAKTQQTKVIKDSSLIGPQLSTLSSSNILLSDNNRSEDVLVLSESDYINLIPFDSSLKGPRLAIEHSPAILDFHVSQGNILTSQTEVLTTSSSQIESKLNQKPPTNLLLDSSLTGSHLEALPPFKPLLNNVIQSIDKMIPLESELTDLIPLNMSQVELTNELVQPSISAKPLLTNEIQTINEVIPLESDLTDLTPLDISEVDFINEPSKMLQHEKSTVTLSTDPKLNETAEHLPTNLVEDKLLLKSDASRFTPLDSSPIEPELKFESLPVITDTIEDHLITTVSQDDLQKINIKHDELESVMLPSSLLPTLLNKLVKPDSNLNIISQETKLNDDFIEISVNANETPLKESDFKIVEPVIPDLSLNANTQITKLNESLSLDNYVDLPLADTSQIYLKETDSKIIEEIPELRHSNIIPLLSKDSTTLKDDLTTPVISLVYHEPQLDTSLIGTSILPKLQRPVSPSTLNSSIQLENSLVGPSILNEIDSQSPVIETVDPLESSIAAATINQNIKPETTTIDSNIQFDSSLIGPTLHSEISSHDTSTVYDSVTQFDTSLVAPSLYEAGTEMSTVSNAESHPGTSLISPSLYETVKASAPASASSQLDSSLLGTSLKPEMETLEVPRICDSTKLDSSLVGQHLSTVPFSSDEVQIKNNELHQKSELANLIPLDSTPIGPHVEFESQSDQSEISWFQNPELSTSDITPGILETIDFLNSDYVERHPPKLNTVSSVYQPDLQELISEFKNSITKSHLSPSEFKPCGKLLLSIDKQSTDNINLSPTWSDLQTLTWNTFTNTPLSPLEDTASEFSPITLAYPEKELGHIVKGPCPDLNYYSFPQLFAKLLPYAQGVPQPPIRPYSPSIPIKQMIDRNWVPKPMNIQNIFQASPGLRAPEDLKLLIDLASQSKTFPQLYMPTTSPPMIAMPPPLEWTTLSNNLPLEKYVPSFPIENYASGPSNLESSICNSEYTPIEVDDIISLLDENSYKRLKDMSILPFSQSSLTPSTPVFETGEIVSPSLLSTVPIFNSESIKTRPVLPIYISNANVPSSIYTNPQISNNPQNIPYVIPTPTIPPSDLQPYSITPFDAQFSEIVDYVPKIESLPVASSKSSLESQWHKIPNTPQLMEPIPNFSPDSEFLQQLLPKPSSLLDSMLQLSTAPNKSKIYPCQLPSAFFSPTYPALTTLLSNAYTSPVLPMFASPLSLSYAKPISASSTRLPLSFTPLPISPHTASSITSDFSDSLRPFKSAPLSNFPIAPTEIYNRPIPSRIPYKPLHMYSSPSLAVYPSLLPVKNSPYSPSFMSNLTPAEANPISPVSYEPLTAPHFSSEPEPKSLPDFGTPTYSDSSTPVSPISMASSPTGVLPPSYVGPDLSTYKYSLKSAPVNTIPYTQPLSTVSPAYTNSISPVSSTLPSYNQLLPSKPIFNLKLELTPQELKNLRLLNTLPITNVNNPFLNSNQMLLKSSSLLPLENYQEHDTKWTPLSNSQIMPTNPSEDKTGFNLQTTSLKEETLYEMIDENMYSYVNDKDNKYYEDYNFKHPIKSLSYTLAPEEIMQTERIPKEVFTKQEDLTVSAPVPNLAFEPSLQSKFYRRPLPTPYTEPSIRPCPTPQLLPHPSLIEKLPQNIFDNKPSEPSLRPLNRPISISISSQYISPLTTTETLKKPFTSPQFISSILPAQTKLQETCPLIKAPLNYQPYTPLPTVPSNAAKTIFKSPFVTSPSTVIPPVKMVEPMSTNLNNPICASFIPQYSLPVSSSAVSKSNPVDFSSNVKYSTIIPDVARLPMTNHITPSSFCMSSDLDFQTIPIQKSTLLQSLPSYSYPSPTLIEPLERVPYETAKKPLIQKNLPQNIFKPNSQYSNGKYTAAPLSSSYLTRPLEIIESFQTQPLPTNKPHPKLSPISAQSASQSLPSGYTSLPFETITNSQINKPRVPQYSLANVPSYDGFIQSSPLARNPSLNQDFKLTTEVSSYPVPKNQISPLILTPYESILLSNLRPLDVSKDALESSPITSSTPLSLLKPFTKTMTQKSRQYQSEMIPINSQYVSQSQIDSAPQLLPSINPLLKSPLLKPLLTNIQSYTPSLANYAPYSNITFSETHPMQFLPFVSNNQKKSASSESLVSELSETVEPINPVPVTPYSFLKPAFYKQYQSPVTMTNIPTYSNYDVLKSSPYLPIKGNSMNTVGQIEVSPISAVESSRLPLDSLNTEEEMVPYELRPDLEDKFLQLPLNFNQQRQFSSASSYIARPQPTDITSASLKYITARPRPFSTPSVVSEDVELIDTTDFIPISPIQSEALTSSYSTTDRKSTPSNIPELNTLSSSPHTILSNSDSSPSNFKQLPPKSITNTQSIQEPDVTQFFPYSISSYSDLSPLSTKELLPTIQKQRNNQRPQPSPIYLSPQEYEDLTKELSSSQASSSSSPVALPSTNIDTQLITNWLTARPIPLTPLYDSPISKAPENLLSPIASSTDDDRSYTTISPEIYKYFTVIPFKHLDSVPNTDTSSRLTDFNPEIADSIESVPYTNSDNQNYINPFLKSYSQMKPTNAVEVTDTSEKPSSSFNPFNDIKYSGYKTYQIPSLISPKTTQNLGALSQIYIPSSISYSPLNSGLPPDIYQNASPPEYYEPKETFESITAQCQASQKITTPLQTKPGLDTLQESPELNEYEAIEDESACVDDIKEDNELKSSLINYIKKRNDIKNNLENNNIELTIPIGNIAITKKAPFNADTIETNNPSVALKVWKSNVKIAQAELKLKFKDLSVNNFMPVVNNIDNYDMEEIRKIVKNYIDEKYGNHVEIKEPYTVDNQYTVVKDFEPNAVSNKYNLLWPTNYV